MTNTRPGKGYYSEAEAASSLGISLEDLRALVRRNVLDNEEDVANLPMTSFQPSDLLLLRLILGQSSRQQAAAI